MPVYQLTVLINRIKPIREDSFFIAFECKKAMKYSKLVLNILFRI